jgi:hypothetical protein
MLHPHEEARSLPRSHSNTQHVQSSVPHLRGLFLALICGLMAACATSPGGGPASVDRAERPLQQGDSAAAAAIFERLAANNPGAEGTGFAMRAVRAWISAGRANDAQRVYGSIAAPSGEPLATDYRLLGIEVLFARGQLNEAWQRASALPVPRDRADQLRLYSLQRRVALAAGRPIEGVQAGISAERAAANDGERATARRDLLLQLRQAAERGVRLDPAAARDAMTRGWLELGQIAANAARSPLSASGEIDRWRGRYPGHPGSTIAFADILGSSGSAQVGSAAGAQVALLLPLTGRAAAQAAEVRDGVTASFGTLPESQRPVVKVYDTGTTSVEAAIATAQAEGASFIVGPLTREEIVAAADHAPRGIPMLLLNYLPFDRAAGPQVYQFALSPEEEARQVARRAIAYGQLRGIVLAPPGDWGTRVVAAFRDEYTRGGGTVLVQAAYDATRNDFSAIPSALRIDESRARHKRMEEIAGSKLNFEARRRGDVQMIFAAGEPLALRQIRPQLRFYFAGNVPTYMTSLGFDPDASANRDIEGVIFPDTPWMLQNTGPVAEQRELTRTVWADKGWGASRLFAFGFDAGQLVLGLRNSQTRWPMQGVTGRLSPDRDRHITRDLDWAEIRGGQPQATPPRP